jgi:hypothetical protein
LKVKTLKARNAARDKAFTAFLKSVPKLVREAYSPVVKKGQAKKLVSQMGGEGPLLKGEKEPKAKGEPLFLALQLVAGDLPASFKKRLKGKVLQFFVANSDAWANASPMLLRLVDAANLDIHHRAPSAFPSQMITGWTAFEDGPHSQEHSKLAGAELENLPAYQDLVEKTPEKDKTLQRLSPRIGDKLGGWP